MESERIRVLLADDQELIRLAYATVLDAADGFELVGVARDGVEAVTMARDLTPDVVLMDIRMPRMGGIEATEAIVAQTPSVRVVAVTTFDLDEYLLPALQAGASGFVLKDISPTDLLGAIRTVHGGESFLAPTATTRLLERFVKPSAVFAAEAGLGDRLSAREMDVVRCVCEGKSNAEIAQSLTISEATVKSHIARILAKLDARDRVQIVLRAFQSGMVGRPGR